MTHNGFLTIMTFVSAMLFPWPFTALLALIAALFEPLVPLAVGLFVDTLYYTSVTGAFPLFTLYGLFASIIAILVRRQLQASIIK